MLYSPLSVDDLADLIKVSQQHVGPAGRRLELFGRCLQRVGVAGKQRRPHADPLRRHDVERHPRTDVQHLVRRDAAFFLFSDPLLRSDVGRGQPTVHQKRRPGHV